MSDYDMSTTAAESFCRTVIAWIEKDKIAHRERKLDKIINFALHSPPSFFCSISISHYVPNIFHFWSPSCALVCSCIRAPALALVISRQSSRSPLEYKKKSGIFMLDDDEDLAAILCAHVCEIIKFIACDELWNFGKFPSSFSLAV